eukprot:Phypoly_transcript_05984.p1 GENE.Phypoly_transcript_05984~~Phypoly_transcript_05984.p1  ORF type:complete len:607 (-),score=104.39 Phypoly_transcript_05984:47-1834(-)
MSHNEPKDYLKLPPEGLSEEQRQNAYKKYNGYLYPQREHFLGYQTAAHLDYSHLNEYLKMHINNVGDPFEPGNYTVNSRELEVAVLDYYAHLWHAKTPHDPKDPESYWGYVLSMGSTEGNMYGLWQARDYLQGKTLYHEEDLTFSHAAKNTSSHGPTIIPFLFRNVKGTYKHKVGDPKNARKPIVFFSEDTHYSIVKICRVLDLPVFSEIGNEKYPTENPLGHERWPQTVPSDTNGHGTVDVEKLLKLVEFFAAKGHPPLIILNYGTTFKGAYDDVEKIGNALMPILDKYGLGLNQREITYAPGHTDKRDGFWIHVDGALGATYAPFLRLAHEKGKYSGFVPPKFDFGLNFVHSLNTSGHKWPGAPWPCGIFMTKVKYQIKPPADPAYIGSPDTTFAGSRNGFSSIILWDFLARHSYDSQMQVALDNEEVARYAVQEIGKLSEKLGEKHGKTDEEKKNWLWVIRTPAALTVRFRRPNRDIVQEFSLSGESMYVDDPNKSEDHAHKKSKQNADPEKGKVQRDYAHIYIMVNITKERIDKLVKALSSKDAYTFDDEKHKPERNIVVSDHKDTHAKIEHFGDLKTHALHAGHNNHRGF